MNHQDKLHAEISRAARAEALLGNELLAEAFSTLESSYIEEWRLSQFRDTDARERLWQAVNVARKVRDHLASAVRNGRLAQRELDDLGRG
jgi:hypothetical protein